MVDKKQIKLVILVFMIVGMYMVYFFSRYTFGTNVAITSCLNARLLIIDTWDVDVQKGELAAFRMNKENPFYPSGLKWVKKVAGTGGSRIQVFEDRVVSDGQVIKLSMSYVLRKLGKTAGGFERTVQIPEGQYFLMGETLTSYDSRFWGTVSQNEIIGQAYVVF